MSAPAQKAAPLPVSTTARTRSSAAASCSAANSSRSSAWFRALRFSGRCSRMRRTCSHGSSTRMSLSEDKQHVSFLHEVAFVDPNLLHLAVDGRRDGNAHLHRFQDDDFLTRRHHRARRHRELVHNARHRRGHLRAAGHACSPPGTSSAGISISIRSKLCPKHLPKLSRRSDELAPPPKASRHKNFKASTLGTSYRSTGPCTHSPKCALTISDVSACRRCSYTAALGASTVMSQSLPLSPERARTTSRS